MRQERSNQKSLIMSRSTLIASLLTLAAVCTGCAPFGEVAGDPFVGLERQLARQEASAVDPFIASAAPAVETAGRVHLDSEANDASTASRSALMNGPQVWATSSMAQMQADAGTPPVESPQPQAGRSMHAVSYAAFTCEVAQPSDAVSNAEWQPLPQTTARPVSPADDSGP